MWEKGRKISLRGQESINIAGLVLSGSVWFVDGSSAVRTAVVLKHQELVILTVEHLQGNTKIGTLEHSRIKREVKERQIKFVCGSHRVCLINGVPWSRWGTWWCSHQAAGSGSIPIWAAGASVWSGRPSCSSSAAPNDSPWLGQSSSPPAARTDTQTHPCFILDPVLSPSPAGLPSWWNINRLISSVLPYLEAHFGCERVFLWIIQTITHPHSLQLWLVLIKNE